jgi:ubiquitin C-terminal hydrolase
MRNSPILVEREETHGDFEMKSIWIQEIMENLVGLYSWDDMEADKKEAIHMILVKLSRIIYGDSNHVDHWDDIAGYATLVSERLNKK